jgi:hypothetical protein
MARNSSVIKSYIRLYTRNQIEAALKKALDDFATGAKFTSHSWDGTSTTATLTGRPEDLIDILNACLEAIDAEQTTAPPRSIFVGADFSKLKS